MGKNKKPIRLQSNITSTNLSDAHGSKEKSSDLAPKADTVFKAFLSARFCSAIWSFITDCDETFNYWETLHYLLYGHGLQTWEYSPQFALRSYSYLLMHGVPAWIYRTIFDPSPLLIFYFVRSMLGLCCSIVEFYFYKAVCREFGVYVGRLWLIFQLFSPGMFISSTALLPSTFSMYFSSAAVAAWWNQKYKLAVFFTAISALLGWPFAILIGVPLAFDLIVRKRLWKTFITWTVISGLTIILPTLAIDSAYFGKLTVAPLNIVMYNVFTNHGPNLYGTEPFSYYLVNGFLNFNIVWILCLLTPMMIVLEHFFVPSKSKSTLSYPYYVSLAPIALWLLVFGLQPHKEERFLYPIYPFISLCGAISLDIVQKIQFRLQNDFGRHYLDHTIVVGACVLILSSLLGFSRIFALYKNYHSTMDVLISLNDFKNSPNYRGDKMYNLCIGKDWYRFPGSFFLPASNFRVRFLKSEFKGMLPAYYSDEPNATAIQHDYFNDKNQENEYMYFDYQKCDFLLDLDTEEYTDLEPNYSSRSKEWIVLNSAKFLNTAKSNKFLRAFYIPFVSSEYLHYCNFNLLKRKRN